MTDDRHSQQPSSPGMPGAPDPQRDQLRSLALLAGVAEDARRWMMEVAAERPLAKISTHVPHPRAVRWVESCRIACPIIGSWGPERLIDMAGSENHCGTVQALMQSINEAIVAATTAMAAPEAERGESGAYAAHKVVMAVAFAQSLLPGAVRRTPRVDQFALPPEPPVHSDGSEKSPRLSTLRSLIAWIVRGVSYIVTTGVCLVVGTMILTGVVWASAELRLSFEESAVDYTTVADELAGAIRGAPLTDIVQGVLWMLLILGIIALGVRSTRHAIDAVIHIIRQSNRSYFGFPLVESRCVPAVVSHWCGRIVETFPLTSAHVLTAMRSLMAVLGRWRRGRVVGS